MTNKDDKELNYRMKLNESEAFAVCKLRSKYAAYAGRLLGLLFLALVLGFAASISIEASLMMRFLVMAAPFVLWLFYFAYIVVKRNGDAMKLLEMVKNNGGENSK